MEAFCPHRAFAALGQPTRLDTFRLLVKAGPEGLAAGEIAAALGVRQNTLSANLSVLTGAGLLRATRQGRSIRYAVDFAGLEGMLGFLLRDCCGGAPALCRPLIDEITRPTTERTFPMLQAPFNVLFLCTGNSARSLMAEAILNREGRGRFRAFSAGAHPAGAPHPYTLDLLDRLGYNTAAPRSKSWDVFTGEGAPRLDFVFTVCDRAAAEPCPVWPGQPMTAHWGVPDPVAVEGVEAVRRVAFSDAYKMLATRIGLFTELPLETIERLSLKARLDEIGGQGAPETAA